MNTRKRILAFTVVELVIVIAIIALMSAIIIPYAVNGFQNSTEKIVDIYNGDRSMPVVIVDADTGDTIFSGRLAEFELEEYRIVSISYGSPVKIKVMKNSEEGNPYADFPIYP